MRSIQPSTEGLTRPIHLRRDLFLGLVALGIPVIGEIALAEDTPKRYAAAVVAAAACVGLLRDLWQEDRINRQPWPQRPEDGSSSGPMS